MWGETPLSSVGYEGTGMDSWKRRLLQRWERPEHILFFKKMSEEMILKIKSWVHYDWIHEWGEGPL